MSELTGEVAEFVANTAYEDLPGPVVQRAKLAILDALAAGISGTNCPTVQRTWGALSRYVGAGPSSLWGGGGRTQPQEAALVNGARMHAYDFDAVHDVAIVHAYTSALPAALALAEARGNVTGRDLIAATVLGTEVGIRVGYATREYKGFILTAICGGFGAAAAAARILGLDQTRTRDALGIAYAQTAGNRQAFLDGADTTRLQPGLQSRAGVVSALLAEGGVSGAHRAFEGQRGFFAQYSESASPDPQALVADLGTVFYTSEISTKPYPSCRGTHGPIQAALSIADGQALDPAEIHSVEVTAAANATGLFRNLSTPFKAGPSPHIDAQYSIPFTVAASLAKGRFTLAELVDDVVLDEGLHSLAGRVTVEDTLPAPHPKALAPVNMRVTLKSGEVREAAVDSLLGSPEAPLSWDDVAAKLRGAIAFARPDWTDERTDKIIAAVGELEALTDLTPLLGALTD